MCRKIFVEKLHQQHGSRLNLKMTGDLPYIRGAGPYETLRRSDGKKRFLILPKMQINPKSRTRFPNLTWDHPDTRKRLGLGLVSVGTRNLMECMPAVSRECLAGPRYVFRDGERRVEPYFDCIRSVASQRQWPGVDISVADFFSTRFPAYTRRYWEILIRNQRISVNTQRVDPEYRLREGDVVSNMMHKHENIVQDLQIQKIFENQDFVVVDKPRSWPVYPIGNYKFNTLIYILMREQGYSDLRTVHRIDAATSGICILAKRPGVTARLQKYFQDKEIKKDYLALVDGHFTPSETVCEEPLTFFKISPRKILKQTSPKSAKTIFKCLSYDRDTNTSLVQCTPVTGRTHQIRLHLAHLGFFIVNDALYNEKDFEEERTELNQAGLESVLHKMENNELMMPKLFGGEEEFKDNLCMKCQNPSMFPPSTLPPPMCLHSFKYSLRTDFSFESSFPSWAESPAQVRGVRNC